MFFSLIFSKNYKIVFQSGDLMKKPAQINSPIQCMDQAWSMIFVGTKSGHVLRFNINKVNYYIS